MISKALAAGALILLTAPAFAGQQQPTTGAPAASPAPAAAQAAKIDPKVARRIAPDEVKKRTDAGEAAIFVDTRGKIGGPVIVGAVPLLDDEIAAWAEDVPKDAFIVAYCTCHAENSSSRAVLKLQEYGFTNAYALHGGMGAWSAAGYATEVPPGMPATSADPVRPVRP